MPNVLVLGASGLIGECVAAQLRADGFATIAVARAFTRAQRAAQGEDALETPLMPLDAAGLQRMIEAADADVIVNCIGVLQDGPGGSADETHNAFVARLAAAARGRLVVHLSIPHAAGGATAFSRTKAAGEGALASSGTDYAILRPGFVVAPVAYGGSALLRALAALGLDLPRDLAASPFMITGVDDIARSVALLTQCWRAGERGFRFDWDVMSPERTTLADVLAAFRLRLGGPDAWMRMPGWTLALGAVGGDLAGGLGWRAPTRSTAVAELRRGVCGDPTGWMRESGVAPLSLAQAIAACGAGVQDKWFARLYLLKGVGLAALALFWIATGAIAVTVALDQSTSIMRAALAGSPLAAPLVWLTSLADIAIGCAIATKKTSRAGLVAGVLATLGYLAAGAALAPHLWVDALGPFVKDIPAVVAMLALLAASDDR